MRFSVLGKWPSAVTSPGKGQGFVHTAACMNVRLAAPTLLSMKLSGQPGSLVQLHRAQVTG